MWQIYYQASISLIICSTHVIYIAVASTQVNRIDEFCRRGGGIKTPPPLNLRLFLNATSPTFPFILFWCSGCVWRLHLQCPH